MKNINRLSFFAIALLLVFGFVFSTLSTQGLGGAFGILSASAQTNTNSDASVNIQADSSIKPSVKPTFWESFKSRWFKTNSTINSGVNNTQAPDNVSIPTTNIPSDLTPKTQSVKYNYGMTDSPTTNTGVYTNTGAKETQSGIIGRWNLDSIEVSTGRGIEKIVGANGSTMSFVNTNKFEFIGTCNQFSGTWQLSKSIDERSGQISFSNVSQTKKLCAICQGPGCAEEKAKTDKYIGMLTLAKTALVNDWLNTTKLTLIAVDETTKEKVLFTFSRKNNITPITPIDGGIKPIPPIRPNPPTDKAPKDFSNNAIESRFGQTFRQLSEAQKKLSSLADRVEAEAKKMAINGSDIAVETKYILQAQANLKRVSTAIAEAEASFKIELQAYRDTKPASFEENLSINSSINSSENVKRYFTKTLANINTAKASLKTAKDNIDQAWSLLKAKLQEEREARGEDTDSGDNSEQSTESSQ